MKAIINTKLIMEDGIIWDGALLFKNGKIVRAGWAKDISVPQGAEIIDAKGLYTAPGLVDIHNHGGGQWLFAEDPLYCSRYFLKHGVTTVLPTLYHNLSMEQMLEAAQKIRKASKTGAGKIMDGLYMEGPFMRLSGSYRNQIKWNDAITGEEVRQLVDGLADMVRVWAIDPERENIQIFLDYVKEKTPGVILAHGHSGATSEAVRQIRHYGIKVRTHITDAGQAKGRAQGTPGAGGDQFCLYEPDQYAEVICDETGIHIPPDLIKLIVQTKGVRRVALISDCMPSRTDYINNAAEGIWYGPDLNYDETGWLAGSRMTLDNAVRNVMTHTGYGLCHAIRMAALTPAELLGIDNRVGSISPGKTAKLILIDDTAKIHSVFLEGELAAQNGEVLI